MTKRDKLKQILQVLDPSKGTRVDFAQFDAEIAKLKDALTEKIQVTTLDDVNNQLDKFKKKINFDSILEAVANLETTFDVKIKGVTGLLNEEVNNLRNLLASQDEISHENVSSIVSNVEELKITLANLGDQNKEFKNLWEQINKLQVSGNQTTQQMEENFSQIQQSIEHNDQEIDTQLQTFTETLTKLRQEFNNRLANLGGGNANRNIAIGGNTSVLSRYTDINIKAGTNVTLTYSNNNTSKYLDLTVAATGGGGGTTRSINSISTSQAAGSTSGTDYVYICSVGVQLTLPDAAANTNLYTVKNTSTSSILVATTSSQTIDAQSNLILATQYTSVDLISDGSNWEIT